MADVGVTESAAKKNGLLDRFQKGETLLGLMIAARPVVLPEQLNSELQAKSANVSGMLETVKFNLSLSEHGIQMKCSTKYQLFEKGEKYELDPLEIPRRRCPLKDMLIKLQNQLANPEEHYRKQYLEFLDA